MSLSRLYDDVTEAAGVGGAGAPQCREWANHILRIMAELEVARAHVADGLKVSERAARGSTP